MPAAAFVAVVALSFWLCLFAPAQATQLDPELDALFARLQATTDPVEGEALQGAIWTRWIATDDAAAGRMMLVGMRAMQDGRLADALSTFDALVEAAPDYAEAWNKRATLHYMLGNLAASVADIERTLALEPRHFGALSGLGLIYQSIDNGDAARRAFEAALKVNPHMPTVRATVDDLRKRDGESRP